MIDIIITDNDITITDDVRGTTYKRNRGEVWYNEIDEKFKLIDINSFSVTNDGYFPYTNFTNNGSEFADINDFRQFLEDFFHNAHSGGVPVLSKGQFIVGGNDGNEYREIRPTDLKVNINTDLNIPVQNYGDMWLEGGVQVGISLEPFTLSARDNRGALKSTFPQSNQDVVDYYTFMPSVNESLSSETTNAGLNTIYDNVPLGKLVINPSINYMWIKYASTRWKKIKLEDVS